MILSLTIGVLVAGGVYLLLQRSMVRAVFGIGLFSHAANLLILASGVTSARGVPFGSPADPASAALAGSADPLPQAFVLTAIVITLAVMVLMLALSVIGHDDDMDRMPETGESHER